MASIFETSVSEWEWTWEKRSPPDRSPSSAASSAANAACASSMSAATALTSASVAAPARRGPASARTPLNCATPKAAESSGTLCSLTRLCRSATRLNENHPTRLAATVSTTAPPSPK